MQNLFQYSEDVSQAYWQKANVTLVGGEIAPDGSATAYAAFETVANAQHSIQRLMTTVITVGRVYTASIFVKKGAGSTRSVILVAGNGSEGFYVDLDNLNSRLVVGTNVLGAGAESVGNGWFRVWVTFRSTSGAANHYFRVEPAVSVGGTSAYVGDPTFSMVYWGFQFTETNGPPDYVKTTTAVVNGRVPRGKRPRQNFVQYSNLFTSMGSVNVAIVADAGQTPPTGETAWRVTGTGAGNLEHQIQPASSSAAFSTELIGTFSIYVKAGTRNYAYIRTQGGTIIVYANLANGTITTTGGVGSGIEYCGDGWYRIWAVVKCNPNTNYLQFYCGPSDPAAFTYVADGTYIYMASPQVSFTNGPVEYVSTGATTNTINEGTPRAQRVGGQNLTTSNSDSLTGWSLSGTTASLNGDSHPLGATVSRLYETAAVTYHYALSGFSRADGGVVSVGANEVFTCSFDLKAGTKPYAMVQINGSAFATINLNNGTTINTGGSGYVSHTVDPIGDGWYRVSVTGRVVGGAHILVYTADATGATLILGDPANYVLVARAQTTATNAIVDQYVSSIRTSFITPRGRGPRKENLIKFSSSLTNAAWTAANCTIAAAAEAPPPGVSENVFLLSDNAVNTVHQLSQGTYTGPLLAVTSGAVRQRFLCMSVYVKSAGAMRWLAISYNGGASSVSFDILNGMMTPPSAGGAQGAYGGIENAGNGWFRCWFMVAFDGVNSPSLALPLGGTAATPTFVYVGAGNGVYVCAPQASMTNGPVEYAPTDALLVEEGTPRGRRPLENLLSASEALTNATFWTQSQVTLTPGIAGPDGSLTAYRMTDSVVNTTHQILDINTYNGVTSWRPHTLSIYAKAGTNGMQLSISGDNDLSGAVFDPQNGVVASIFGNVLGYEMRRVGSDGWYRCSVTFTGIAATLGYSTRIKLFKAGVGFVFAGTGTDYLDICKPQMTEGHGESEYVTSYPSTSAGRVTQGPPRGLA